MPLPSLRGKDFLRQSLPLLFLWSCIVPSKEGHAWLLGLGRGSPQADFQQAEDEQVEFPLRTRESSEFVDSQWSRPVPMSSVADRPVPHLDFLGLGNLAVLAILRRCSSVCFLAARRVGSILARHSGHSSLPTERD